jgi:hypothetical protein
VQKSFPPSSCSSPPNSVTRSRGVTYKAVLDLFRAGGAVTTNRSILTLYKVQVSFQFFSWYLVKGLQCKTRDSSNPGTCCSSNPQTRSNQFFNKWWWENNFWACTLFSLRSWEVMPLHRIGAAVRGSGRGPAGKERKRKKRRSNRVREEEDPRRCRRRQRINPAAAAMSPAAPCLFYPYYFTQNMT